MWGRISGDVMIDDGKSGVSFFPLFFLFSFFFVRVYLFGDALIRGDIFVGRNTPIVCCRGLWVTTRDSMYLLCGINPLARLCSGTGVFRDTYRAGFFWEVYPDLTPPTSTHHLHKHHTHTLSLTHSPILSLSLFLSFVSRSTGTFNQFKHRPRTPSVYAPGEKLPLRKTGVEMG